MLSRSPSPDFDPSTMSIDFAPLPEYIAACDTNLDFGGLLSTPLKVHEDRKSGCGGQTWPAGVVLARHMLRYHRDSLKDARILEIGAGGGLVGLAVANGCKPQKSLYITDQLEMLELMGHNIVLNEAEGHVKAMILNWFVQLRLILPQDNRTCAAFKPWVLPLLHMPPADTRNTLVYRLHWKTATLHLCLPVTTCYLHRYPYSALHLLSPIALVPMPGMAAVSRYQPSATMGEALPAEIQQIKPDVILAADCAYYEPSFPMLLQTLRDLLALCPSATVYFCFMKRRRADTQFIKNAKKSFVVTEVADDDRPVFSRAGLFLYAFTSKERPADAPTS